MVPRKDAVPVVSYATGFNISMKLKIVRGVGKNV